MYVFLSVLLVVLHIAPIATEDDPDSVCYPSYENCDFDVHICIVNPNNQDEGFCFCKDANNCDTTKEISFIRTCPDSEAIPNICGENGNCANNENQFGYCVCNEGWTGPTCEDQVTPAENTIDPWGGDPSQWGGDPNQWGGDPNQWNGGAAQWGGDANQWGGDPNQWNVGVDQKVQPDYKPQHTAFDPNLQIYVPVVYDANSFDPHDPFVNATFLDTFNETSIHRTCNNEEIVCDENSPYRTLDGTCNNLDNPIWGAANTVQMRFLDPLFEKDTVPADNVPRKKNIPSARDLSNECFDNTRNQHFSVKHSTSMVWFGQFLAHDIALTKQHEEPKDCCNETNHANPNCFTIAVPSYDAYFPVHCLNFVRSLTGTRGCRPDNPDATFLDYHEVLNFQTSFIDLSATYGTSNNESIELRQLEGGKLKVKEGEEGTPLLPEDNSTQCPMRHPDAYCQKTGDKRVNDVPYLGATHLLFVRAHNWIASQLNSLGNDGWDDERLFQEARKILIALFQHIVYSEYLPELLGTNLVNNNLLSITETGFQEDYDSTRNPGIFNEFIGAVFRMGHSMIPPHQAYLMPDHCLMDWYTVIDNFRSSHMLYVHGGLNLTSYVRWMTWDKCMRNDRFIEQEFRNWFNGGDDLGARNIQRGRDHGINNYNSFRQFCGLKPITFDDYILLDHDFETSEKLRSIYRYADDIDLYVGGLSELPRGGSLLGPTFTCLMIKQFRSIRISDRFWYERENVFTEDQLNSIKTMTLAKLVCENYGLETVQPSMFRLANYKNENQLVNCTSLPNLDFNLWSA